MGAVLYWEPKKEPKFGELPVFKATVMFSVSTKN